MDYNYLADILFPDVTETPEDMEKRYPPRVLPEGAKVTRFAPSPTGFVHFGGLFPSTVGDRLAHQSGGVFYLRIEDTDAKREVPGAAEALIRTLETYGINFDEGRLLTECALAADKLAIDEELVRLDSHFAAFDEIVESDEPVGRRLDFLLQEINRETNTIGSKANNAEIAKLVVEIKAELEKIREQIQNIE